jgi:hypothetical protein
VKRERIHGKLHPRERILLKHRRLKNSHYLKWLEGDKKGRELLFAEHMNDGRLMVVAAPRFIFNSVVRSLDPTSSSALEGTRHPHTEYDIGSITERLHAQWERARSSPGGRDLRAVRFLGKKKLNKRAPSCHVFEVVFRPVDRLGVAYEYPRVIVGFDPEELLVVVFEGYRSSASEETRDRDLLARYLFRKLRVDLDLKERDFSPLNPEYRFKHR